MFGDFDEDLLNFDTNIDPNDIGDLFTGTISQTHPFKAILFYERIWVGGAYDSPISGFCPFITSFEWIKTSSSMSHNSEDFYTQCAVTAGDMFSID